MKKGLFFLFALVAFGARGQTNQAPAGDSVQAQLRAKSSTNTFALHQLAQNELSKGRVVMSGSAVEALKTHKPLQLLNPAAPVEYGSPEDNLVRDPINNRVMGVKFFALRF